MDPFSLKDEVALVTASTRGIGRAIAHRFAEVGAAVVVNGRSAEAVETVVAEIRSAGGRAAGLAGDALSEDLPDAIIDLAFSAFGDLTILVNNAGTGRHGPLLTEISEEEFRSNFEYNVVSCWRFAASAAKRMKRGSIINVSSSTSRQRGMANMGAYAASKGAMDNLTRTMAIEFAPDIRVNGIAPGPIPTELFKHASGATSKEDLNAFLGFLKMPMNRFGKPEEIAYAAQFLCSPAAAWITGEVLTISGGQ
ncbi:7-alpha-hydroxysteroid dehydrogenase [Sphingobium faniae]|nr:7-alpha-hydroxysteroid dehydrogenase [Sphingobium faniae]